jgi:predicted nucleic acid-binding protein
MIKIDASSLIVSLKMNFIDVLNKLYEDLIITEAIYQEVIINGKSKGKEEAIIGEKLIKDKKITIHKVDEELMDLKLGLGETEVIHNSINVKCLCMMEDKKAKRIAESFNLDVRKIPISILEAYQNKIIDNLEYEDYLIKWIKYASPSYEEVYFVKKIKELL